MHRHLQEPHPFAFDSASTHYASDRPVVPEHVRITVDLDFDKKSIRGQVKTRLRAVRAVKQVSFDAVSMDVASVEVDGKSVDFDNNGESLHVHLRKKLSAGDIAEVKVKYRCTPERGLYFIAPEPKYPDRPLQAWTQGQDEDSRHWFPCLDAPAQKASSEVIATFPAGMTALSNGRLVADATKGDRRTMHHRLDAPHSPYLVTLVVGEFEEHVALGKTAVRTLFPKGKKDDALRCVKRTPDMVQFFEKLTGQNYPWGDYAQVFVAEFIFGGMENTSATTLTDSVLHDARAHADFSAEPLISHELAHQWFGDLLTCRDWPHGWLNEGFATYSEILWKEEADGIDEADHARMLDFEAYEEEASSRYQRPIVARGFDEPIELFDRHLYEKGSLVLHELRTRLGEDDFRKVIHAYVAAHRGGSVETVDLARAVEAASGRNFDRFFDAYVFRAGHPELKIDVKYDSSAKQVVVKVSQGAVKEPYAFPLRVEWVVQGKLREKTLEVAQGQEVFFLPAEREPTQVVVDGRRDLLAVLEVKKPMAYWRSELAQASSARARTEAAHALGHDVAAPTVVALTQCLGKEKEFWGTRAAAASSLAKLRTLSARDALLKAVTVKHPKVRRAVVQALGAFLESDVVEKALKRICAEGDASVFVEADAARSLAKVAGEAAVPALVPMLSRSSFIDTVACGAVDALAETKCLAAWKKLIPLTAYGTAPFLRRSAAMAVAKLAEHVDKKHEAVDALKVLVRDPQFRVQMTAIAACQTLGDVRLVSALSSTPFLDGRAKRAAREAVRSLRTGEAAKKDLAALRKDYERLATDVAGLKEALAAKSKAKAKTAG